MRNIRPTTHTHRDAEDEVIYRPVADCSECGTILTAYQFTNRTTAQRRAEAVARDHLEWHQRQDAIEDDPFHGLN